jgi:hypothetical protein
LVSSGIDEASLASTFKSERLIARDDQDRFQSSSEKAETNMSGAGGDATLGMNIFKSLKALAGDNDRIFVILDDREDLWQDRQDMSIP